MFVCMYSDGVFRENRNNHHKSNTNGKKMASTSPKRICVENEDGSRSPATPTHITIDGDDSDLHSDLKRKTRISTPPIDCEVDVLYEPPSTAAAHDEEHAPVLVLASAIHIVFDADEEGATKATTIDPKTWDESFSDAWNDDYQACYEARAMPEDTIDPIGDMEYYFGKNVDYDINGDEGYEMDLPLFTKLSGSDDKSHTISVAFSNVEFARRFYVFLCQLRMRGRSFRYYAKRLMFAVDQGYVRRFLNNPRFSWIGAAQDAHIHLNRMVDCGDMKIAVHVDYRGNAINPDEDEMECGGDNDEPIPGFDDASYDTDKSHSRDSDEDEDEDDDDDACSDGCYEEESFAKSIPYGKDDEDPWNRDFTDSWTFDLEACFNARDPVKSDDTGKTETWSTEPYNTEYHLYHGGSERHYDVVPVTFSNIEMERRFASFYMWLDVHLFDRCPIFRRLFKSAFKCEGGLAALVDKAEVDWRGTARGALVHMKEMIAAGLLEMPRPGVAAIRAQWLNK